ncbi:MAG: OmpA family protein [Nitrospirota bacterium]|nr:OmpA family protein [Nitrospirota bacterium]
MTKVLSFSKVMRVGKLGLVGGCLIAIVAGCSSRLQTTIMSGTEPPAKPQVAKLESVTPPAEAAVQTPVQAEKIIGIPPTDIPVEEPARPVIRHSAPADIFATPRTGVVEQAVPVPLEAPLVAEPVVPPSPIIASPTPSQISPQESPKVFGIPPISFEPEMPAFPTIREEAAPPEEPVQIAKVVPAAPEAVESKPEDLLKALGDVYFDYDRFTIRTDAIPVLQENAHALVAALSDKNIVIEGHCDERGTESYNMVLGKRRGNAVKEFLVDLGVPGDKLQVMSYGKEKPFCTDQNEECWQENRRGHFIVQ